MLSNLFIDGVPINYTDFKSLLQQCLPKKETAAAGATATDDLQEKVIDSLKQMEHPFPQFPLYPTGYIVNKTLVSGAFATVVQATTINTSIRVAIKQSREDEGGIKASLNEEKILKELYSKNPLCSEWIIQCHGGFPVAKQRWTIYELFKGDLCDHRESVDIYRVVDALFHALYFLKQEGCVHRDIKPDNVLLHENGKIILADFGGAHLIKTTPRANEYFGTMQYMAPEIALSTLEAEAKITAVQQELYNQAVQPPSDMWSLGITLLGIYSGTAPLSFQFSRMRLPSQLHILIKKIEELCGDFIDPLDWKESNLYSALRNDYTLTISGLKLTPIGHVQTCFQRAKKRDSNIEKLLTKIILIDSRQRITPEQGLEWLASVKAAPSAHMLS